MNAKKNSGKKSDIKDRTIARQAKEIEALKIEISKVKAMCEEKDAIIKDKENEAAEFNASMNELRSEFKKNIEELKQKSKEYDNSLVEIKEMRKILSEDIFKSELRWRIVRWLIK